MNTLSELVSSLDIELSYVFRGASPTATPLSFSSRILALRYFLKRDDVMVPGEYKPN